MSFLRNNSGYFTFEDVSPLPSCQGMVPWQLEIYHMVQLLLASHIEPVHDYYVEIVDVGTRQTKEQEDKYRYLCITVFNIF